MSSVCAGLDLIGHTALESRGAPMGVAFGLFIPSDGYARVRNVCQQNHSLSEWVGKTVPMTKDILTESPNQSQCSPSGDEWRACQWLEITVTGRRRHVAASS